ncbi:EPT/RTPC-like protein [Sporormia fimetaria CBS 119925]|uniref:EPT/RTPC-like protein n=1 Tax=Sporormia fimetaria CBS 119925 TaxID=1340428 RepID=A0A6A6V0V3_9PLEO|nr:EPT/RTPC-like protein [Sporormia fimetaria CBS 119925]
MTVKTPDHYGEFVRIDNNQTHGSGLTVRLAATLSALTTHPVHVTNIGDYGPQRATGLTSDHIVAIEWLARFTNAHVKGLHPGSKELSFVPYCKDKEEVDGFHALTHEELEGEDNTYRIEEDTSANVQLTLQGLLPYILFSGAKEGGETVTLHIAGVTHEPRRPTFDWYDQVFFPTLEKIGIPRIERKNKERGWDIPGRPPTTGHAEFKITRMTEPLERFALIERGPVVKVTATILCPGADLNYLINKVRSEIKQRGARIFKPKSDGQIICNIESSGDQPDPADRRYYILLVATTEHGLRLAADRFHEGEEPMRKGVLVQRVVRALAGLIRNRACVDPAMWDHMAVYQGLAKGRGKIYRGGFYDKGPGSIAQPPSSHQTAAWCVIEQMLGAEFMNNGTSEGTGYVPGGIWDRQVEEKDVFGDWTFERAWREKKSEELVSPKSQPSEEAEESDWEESGSEGKDEDDDDEEGWKATLGDLELKLAKAPPLRRESEGEEAGEEGEEKSAEEKESRGKEGDDSGEAA